MTVRTWKASQPGTEPIAPAMFEPEGEQAVAGQIRISTEKVQKLGVRTEAAAMRLLGKTVRAAGRIEPDERRVFAVVEVTVFFVAVPLMPVVDTRPAICWD